MNKSSFKKRLIWLDQSKGLAILGIVFFHFFQNYPSSIFLVSFLDDFGAKIGFASVDIFFLLSGFNFGYKLSFQNQLVPQNIDLWSWLKQRIARIYPTYWLAILFSLLIYYLSKHQIKLIDPFDFVAICLALPGYDRFKLINPGFWFVSVIIQAYLIMPWLLKITVKQPKNILLLGIVIGIFNKVLLWSFGLSSNFKSEFYYFLLQNNFIGSYFLPICLGIYWGVIYKKHQGFRQQDWQISIVNFSWGILIQLISTLNNFYVPYKSGLDLFYIPLLLLSIYFLSTQVIDRQIWLSKILQTVGFYSYQIYLIHQPLFFVLIALISSNLFTNVLLTLILTSLLIVIFLSLYVYMFTVVDLYLRKIFAHIYSDGINN